MIESFPFQAVLILISIPFAVRPKEGTTMITMGCTLFVQESCGREVGGGMKKTFGTSGLGTLLFSGNKFHFYRNFMMNEL